MVFRTCSTAEELVLYVALLALNSWPAAIQVRLSPSTFPVVHNPGHPMVKQVNCCFHEVTNIELKLPHYRI